MSTIPAQPKRRAASSKAETRKRIKQLGPWFQNLHLPGGIQTAPDHWLGDFPTFKWNEISDAIPADLNGWRCLEIGCNAGFYTFELAKRGAQVTGIDCDERYLAQAQWAATELGLEEQVDFRQMQVYDLARHPGTYDLVLFMGVLYHLRYPMLGLDIVTEKVGRLMVFQTLTLPGETVIEGRAVEHIHDRALMSKPGWPKMAFLEHEFVGDPTNWWMVNHSGVEAMLRSCGMKILSRPAHEIYLCEPNPKNPSCMRTWNRGEYLSATGQAGRARNGKTE
jgi:tRNA (mo5U34)-methyltransferase